MSMEIRGNYKNILKISSESVNFELEIYRLVVYAGRYFSAKKGKHEK